MFHQSYLQITQYLQKNRKHLQDIYEKPTWAKITQMNSQAQDYIHKSIMDNNKTSCS